MVPRRGPRFRACLNPYTYRYLYLLTHSLVSVTFPFARLKCFLSRALVFSSSVFSACVVFLAPSPRSPPLSFGLLSCCLGVPPRFCFPLLSPSLRHPRRQPRFCGPCLCPCPCCPFSFPLCSPPCAASPVVCSLLPALALALIRFSVRCLPGDVSRACSACARSARASSSFAAIVSFIQLYGLFSFSSCPLFHRFVFVVVGLFCFVLFCCVLFLCVH